MAKRDTFYKIVSSAVYKTVEDTMYDEEDALFSITARHALDRGLSVERREFSSASCKVYLVRPDEETIWSEFSAQANELDKVLRDLLSRKDLDLVNPVIHDFWLSGICLKESPVRWASEELLEEFDLTEEEYKLLGEETFAIYNGDSFIGALSKENMEHCHFSWSNLRSYHAPEVTGLVEYNVWPRPETDKDLSELCQDLIASIK